MDARERAGLQRAVLVVGQKFNQQRTGFLVDAVGRRVDDRVEFPIWIFRQFKRRVHASLHHGRIRLRNRHHKFASCARPRRRRGGPAYESACTTTDVDIAGRHDAVERRGDVVEGALRLQLPSRPRAASSSAFFACASLSFSSTACCETAADFPRLDQRCAVTLASARFALAFANRPPRRRSAAPVPACRQPRARRQNEPRAPMSLRHSLT